MENLKKNFLISAVFFAGGLAYTYSTIFTYALFLSSYPSNWLSYLFISIVAVNITIFSFINKLRETKPEKINRLIVAILLLSGTAVSLAYPFKFFWTPFISCLYSSLVFPAASIICFDLSSQYYSIKEFKFYLNFFLVIRTIAITVGGFSASYITFHSPAWMLYLSVICFCIMGFALWHLPPPPITRNAVARKQEIYLLKYPLIRVLLPMVVFMSTGFFLSDYLLKKELAASYTFDDISYFLGNFNAILNIATLFVQTLIVPLIIHRLGVIPLLYIMPLAIVFGSFIIFFHPTLIPLTAYAIVISLSYFCFHAAAFEIALSPLPLRIKLSAKSWEGGALNYSGLLVTGVLFMLLKYFAATENEIFLTIIFISVAYCGVWFYLIKETQEEYLQALKKMIHLRGFSLETSALLHISQKLKEKFAIDLLEHSSPKLQPLGFSLIGYSTKISPTAFEVIAKKMTDKSPETRLRAIESLESKRFPLLQPFLLEQLKKETDELVISKIVSLLVPLDEGLSAPLVEEFFGEELSPKQVYTIPLALLSKNYDLIGKGIKTLQNAVCHTNKRFRLAAARIIILIPIGDPKLFLEKLIDDPNMEVAIEAIRVASKMGLTPLIPKIVVKLENRDLSHEVFKTLHSFGPIILPELLPYIDINQKFSTVNLAIKTLVSLEGKNAERAIIDLAHHSSDLIKINVAHLSLIMITKTHRSPEHRQQIYAIIVEESQKRNSLKQALKLPLPSYLLNEFEDMLHQTSLRLVYWFGCYENSETVLELSFMFRHLDVTKKEHLYQYNVVLELLTSMASTAELKIIFNNWDKEVELSPTTSLKQYEGINHFLDAFIVHHQQREETGRASDAIEKLMIFRGISLFKLLATEILYSFATKATWLKISAGNVIFSQGDAPNGLYILVEGEVVISSNGNILTTLKPLVYFGELGIIKNIPRTATATSKNHAILLHLNQNTFNALVHEFPDALRKIIIAIIGYLQKK